MVQSSALSAFRYADLSSNKAGVTRVLVFGSIYSGAILVPVF